MVNTQTVILPRNSGKPIEAETSPENRDVQLLQRFVADRDEAAFAGLVQRHGGTVWGVCRRVLQHEQDAEDAFQAVFLILARKAAAIRKGEAVGSWLYGVAYRTAMKARQAAARRHATEQQTAGPTPEPPPWGEAAYRELQRMLDEEVQRLAAKYRAPFVLCCLEGLSKSEAARELGWKEGTVSGRLAQARKLLQTRLARRGVTLSAVLTAMALAQNTAAAASPVLVHATVSAALAGKAAATASPSAFALAEGLLHTMAMAKLKVGIFLLLGLSTLVAGVGLAALQPAAPDEKPAQPAAVLAGSETFLPPPVPLLPPIDEQVLALAFAPDGKRLVTAGARHTLPGQLKIWDVATAQELVAVRVPQGIRSVAFSPDGLTLATGHFGGAIRLRDPMTGQERAVLTGHTIGVNGLAFSADGTLLASAGLDRTVRLWDLKTLQERQVLRGHTDMVFSVAFFRHGRALVTGGQDKTARIWDLATGKEKFLLQGHASPIEMVAVSPDDKLVATGSWDQTIKLWDAETGKEAGTLTAKYGSVLALAFSPSGDLLASAAGDGTIRLWDVKSREEIGKLEQHGSSIWSLAFSADGKLLASGSSDRTAKLWDVAARKEVATLVTSQLRPLRALAYAPDGKALGIATDDKSAQIRDARTGVLLSTLEGHEGTVTCLAFSPDGQTLATGSTDKTLKVWNRAAGKATQTLKGHAGGVYALAFSPDGKVLASASFDQTIKLWDPISGQEAATLKGHDANIHALAFAPDGRSLASGSSDGIIKLWNLAGGNELLRTLKGHDGSVRALAYAVGGALASAGEDGLVKLWEPAEGKERLRLQGHAGGVWALAFSPSGQTLVSGGRDWTVIVWDPVTGQSRQVLHGHKEPVTALAIHPQGQMLATGGQDATVLRWREARSKLPLTVPANAPTPPGEKNAGKKPPVEMADVPKPKTDYRQQYYHSFKGDAEKGQEFELTGPDAEECVQFEPAGLRITLPAGYPDKRVGTGLATSFTIGGDFEITVGYELLKEPEPVDAGQGTGLFVGVDLNTPAYNRATLARAVRQQPVFSTWFQLTREGADQPHVDQLRVFPSTGKTGRLRLVRAGSLLSHYVAEQGSDDFRFLRQHPFGTDDLKAVRIGGETGGPQAVLDARVIDLRIRADSLSGVPLATAEDAVPLKAAGQGWWAAGALIGLVFVLCLVGGLLHVRRSRRAGQVPANAPVPDKPAGAESAAPFVSFPCSGCGKHLKVKAELAGKKVKCPKCGQPVRVPEPTVQLSPPAAEKRIVSAGKKRWLWGLLLLPLSALAGASFLWLHQPKPSPLVDVPLGSEFVAQAKESGFLGDLRDQKGRPFRWTTGNAQLVIPIDPKHPPEALRLHLNLYRPPRANQTLALRITVNQRELFQERVPAEPWERTFELKAIDLGKEVRLEIVSDTFVPDEAQDGTALGVQVRGVMLLSRAEDPANGSLGGKFVSGVKEAGFYGQEYEQDSQPYRWTNGHARLVIPINRGKVPQALQVRLFPWRPAMAPPASLRIVVNGQELFHEQVPREPWERTFGLAGVDLGDELVVEILSDTFVPREYDGGADGKSRGVEVRGVKLLDRAEPAKP